MTEDRTALVELAEKYAGGDVLRDWVSESCSG